MQCDESADHSLFKGTLCKIFISITFFFSGDTQGIIQGAGSNESVEDTGNKVETTVLGNKSMQSQTQHVAGCDVHSFPNDFIYDAKNLQIIYFLRYDLEYIHF